MTYEVYVKASKCNILSYIVYIPYASQGHIIFK